MLSAPDREQAITLIDDAHSAGVGLGRPCQEIGISRRTYNRWCEYDGIRCGGRPDAVRPKPANKLSAAEYQEIVDTMHRPKFASLPPGQVIPALADQE